LRSKLLHRDLHEAALVPSDPKGRPLLVLLHGRSGHASTWMDAPMPSVMAKLGARAPIVVGIDGEAHSYYHDRRDGPWERSVMEEVIPDAVRRYGADPASIAIGGHSMGGFGAIDIAEHHPTAFCAVGGHEPADFFRNDLIGQAGGAHPFGTARVWIDWGDQDSFISGDRALVARIRAGGTKVVTHTWPGTHSMAYVRRHMTATMAFYAAALSDY
jgi:S-formylglutathione hydrolase FrmB